MYHNTRLPETTNTSQSNAHGITDSGCTTHTCTITKFVTYLVLPLLTTSLGKTHTMHTNIKTVETSSVTPTGQMTDHADSYLDYPLVHAGQAVAYTSPYQLIRFRMRYRNIAPHQGDGEVERGPSHCTTDARAEQSKRWCLDPLKEVGII